MATEPPAPTALLMIEPTSASATSIRVVIDDLIDLILRLELASGPRVSRLAARRSSLTLLARKLLRLCSRFRATLLS
jgi:hypothetical protein